ncbi:unnamed protein product, partial [marine sediment metagenome]
VKQPEDSNLCGQACVATLAGVGLEESIRVFGTRGKTTTRQIRQALLHLEVDCGERLVRGFPDGPAILKWTWPNGHSHWCVWMNNKYYDPCAGVHRKPPKYLTRANARVTSHLELYL